jgi:hypothetical protein
MITQVRAWVANLVRVIDMVVCGVPFRLKRRSGLWVQPEVSPAGDPVRSPAGAPGPKPF